MAGAVTTIMRVCDTLSAAGSVTSTPAGAGLPANADLNLDDTATPARYGPCSPPSGGASLNCGVMATSSLRFQDVGAVSKSFTTLVSASVLPDSSAPVSVSVEAKGRATTSMPA